jgi:hypothetical protein
MGLWMAPLPPVHTLKQAWPDLQAIERQALISVNSLVNHNSVLFSSVLRIVSLHDTQDIIVNVTHDTKKRRKARKRLKNRETHLPYFNMHNNVSLIPPLPPYYSHPTNTFSHSFSSPVNSLNTPSSDLTRQYRLTTSFP